MKMYLSDRHKRFSAIAEYNPQDGSFTVLRGSTVSDSISGAPTFRGAKTVLKLRNQYVKACLVQTDVVFTSSSSAANFVTGNSTDGTRTWKDEKGRTFKEIQSETKGA